MHDGTSPAVMAHQEAFLMTQTAVVLADCISGGCRCKQGGGWPKCSSSPCLTFPSPSFWKAAMSCK